MKDIVFRVRIWIAWHAMPKDVRPLFIKALQGLVEELLQELEELEKERKEEYR